MTATGNGGSNDYWRGGSEDGGGTGNNGSVHVDGPIVKSDLDGHITIKKRHRLWKFITILFNRDYLLRITLE